jgi:hypothetical protein
MRCEPAHHFTVAKARAWRSAIDDEPAYQRSGDVWTHAQRQRFIDSLLNGYDVPKIYLHDLRGQHPTKVYAVVDGKQRLTSIWSYLADGFALADDFHIEAPPSEADAAGAREPAGPVRFSALDPWWQRRLLGTYLSVVLIRDAGEADIDELFARLNAGEPLTGAEARNAIAGDMSALIRALAARPELRALLTFPDARGAYREVAAAALALEVARRSGEPGDVDLGPAALDAFVRRWRVVAAGDRETLVEAAAMRLRDCSTSGSSVTRGASTIDAAIEALRSVWATPSQAERASRVEPAAIGQARAAQRSNTTG